MFILMSVASSRRHTAKVFNITISSSIVDRRSMASSRRMRNSVCHAPEMLPETHTTATKNCDFLEPIIHSKIISTFVAILR